MADYKIGFGKPPKGRPFEPGKSGNPKGRPPRAPNQLGEVVETFLNGHMPFREKGKARTAPRQEVSNKLLVQKALNKDVDAADLILKKRAHAVRYGQKSARQIRVVNWLPDYLGQTGEQKAQEQQITHPAQIPRTDELSDNDQNRIPDGQPPHNEKS